MKTLSLVIFTWLALHTEIFELANGASGKNERGSSSNNSVERFKITKPPGDKREYRGLKLRNDLKVALVSDPFAEKSAVSMVIGVGGLNDLQDVPGIANLIGYLLMIGDFYEFLADHDGGTDLPVTRAQDQVFSFEINPTHLVEALDRFANIFVESPMGSSSPLILEHALKILPQELSRRALVDEFRIAEVEKSLCRENHQYCHFFTGTKELLYKHAESLGEDKKLASLFEKVRMFYSFWYSSNLMTLTVLGRESLNQLEKVVVPLFEKIENKNRKKLTFSFENHPWGPEQLKHKIYIVPAAEIQMLRLSFPVPDVSDAHKTSPDVYVGNLIIDHVLLSTEGLCESIEVLFEKCYMAGLSFFTIQVKLTETGVERVDDVIHRLVQHILLLREKAIQEWLFNEQKELYEQAFLESCWDVDLLSYVEQLSYSMQRHSMKEILSYNYTLGEWNPKLIDNFFNYLRLDNMNVLIVSHSFSKLADKMEQYYGTRYGIEEIPNTLLKKWSAKESFPGSYLSVNDFLSENLDLYPTDENEPKYPYLIHQSALSEIWFKQDDKFKVPKLYVTFEVHSPITRFDPGQRMLFCIFNDLLKLSLSKYLDTATLAGFNWHIEMETIYMRIIVEGHNDKLPLLLKKLLSKLTKFESSLGSKDNFKYTLKQHLESYRDLYTEDHFYQLEWHTDYLQTQTGWDIKSIVNAGKTLQYNDMRKFSSKIFRRIFIRGLIHGNCTRHKAMDIVNIIGNAFKSSRGLLLQEILQLRAVEISQGSNFVAHVFNKTAGKYAYSSHFQLYGESSDLKHYVTSVLFYHTIGELCQQTVMSGQSHQVSVLTKIVELQKQLQEISCELLTINGVQGLTITATTTKDPRQINKMVERFLRDAEDTMKNLSDSALKQRKLAVRKGKLAEPSDINDLSELYWSEIENRRYDFDRNKMELRQLRSLKKTDLLTFFKNMFMDGPSIDRRRQLTIYVFPEATEKVKPALINNIPARAVKVNDLEDFKNASTLLPRSLHPQPSVWE